MQLPTTLNPQDAHRLPPVMKGSYRTFVSLIASKTKPTGGQKERRDEQLMRGNP